MDGGYNAVPIGGCAYYISPPRGLNALWIDPIHVIVYISFVLFTCAAFSRFWIEISGQTSKDMTEQLVNNQMVISGLTREEAMVKHLDRYIPVAAAFGGMCIGLLTITGEFLGAIGSGNVI
jgi:protein transport protein SEC61 subunit alpha